MMHFRMNFLSSKFSLAAIIWFNRFNLQRKNKQLSYQLLKGVYIFGTPCIVEWSQYLSSSTDARPIDRANHSNVFDLLRAELPKAVSMILLYVLDTLLQTSKQ